MTEYKIAVCGGGGVGKSSITMMFIQGEFEEAYDPTVEDSYKKECQVDGNACLLDITDTAGQEEYSAMRATYMRASEGFLVVYSVGNHDSFDEVPVFREQINQAKDVTTCPMVICGNKCDLPADEREVTEKEGMDIASKFGAHFLETSARNNTNVTAAFEQCVRLVKGGGSAPAAAAKKKKEKKPKERATASGATGGPAAGGGGGGDIAPLVLALAGLMGAAVFVGFIAMILTSWGSNRFAGYGLTKACVKGGGGCISFSDVTTSGGDGSKLKAGSYLTLIFMIIAMFGGIASIVATVLSGLGQEIGPLAGELRGLVTLGGGAVHAVFTLFSVFFYGVVCLTIDNLDAGGAYGMCILSHLLSIAHVVLAVLAKTGAHPALAVFDAAFV